MVVTAFLVVEGPGTFLALRAGAFRLFGSGDGGSIPSRLRAIAQRSSIRWLRPLRGHLLVRSSTTDRRVGGPEGSGYLTLPAQTGVCGLPPLGGGSGTGLHNSPARPFGQR